MKLTRRALTATALAAGLAAGSAGRRTTRLPSASSMSAPSATYGWTWTHDQGRFALDEPFGDAVETVVAESVPKARMPSGSSPR
jgi:basic membrane protein A